MDSFIFQANKLVALGNDQVSQLIDISQVELYKKYDVILSKGQVCQKLYFINDGLLKISFFSEDKEYIMKFFYTNEFCSILDSLNTKKPSKYTITALTDASLLAISYDGLQKLAKQDQVFEKIISEVPSMATHKMMSRIRELLETDAKERYLNFLETNGHLMKLVSLKDLSGYLGISQVTLSRIRANL